MILNVSQRQSNLRAYKYYYKLDVDGIEGNGTIEAYRNFQRDFNLVVDGIYGPATENALMSAVKDLQRKLNAKGYDLVVDGIVGPATLQAIMNFQSNNGLAVDGIAGPETFKALGESEITWDDIPHFQPSEMTCECGCGLNNTDLRLMQVLEQIRSHFGDRPVFITSGCRCVEYNARVGGIAGSMHTFGKAADFYIQGVNVYDLLAYCQELVNNGIISYTYTNETNMKGVVHINL